MFHSLQSLCIIENDVPDKIQSKFIACEHFPGRHTHDRVAKKLSEIFKRFGIIERVFYITTDNAGEYTTRPLSRTSDRTTATSIYSTPVAVATMLMIAIMLMMMMRMMLNSMLMLKMNRIRMMIIPMNLYVHTHRIQ